MTQKQEGAISAVKWAIGMIVTGLVAWTAMKVTVAENSVVIGNNRSHLDQIDKRLKFVEDCVVGQQVHNQWVKETLTRIDNRIEK